MHDTCARRNLNRASGRDPKSDAGRDVLVSSVGPAAASRATSFKTLQFHQQHATSVLTIRAMRDVIRGALGGVMTRIIGGGLGRLRLFSVFNCVNEVEVTCPVAISSSQRQSRRG